MTQRKARLTLLMIAAIFFLPMAAAMFLYLSDIEWRPAESTVKGALVTPPHLIPDTPLSEGEDSPVLREVWSMVVLSDTSCDEACLETLIQIRQIRQSLGPKMTRIQTVLIPETRSAISQEQLAEHPMLIVARPEAAAAFRAAAADTQSGEIYLVDPFGNLMMRYPAGSSMGDIRNDIKKLFLLSKIG